MKKFDFSKLFFYRGTSEEMEKDTVSLRMKISIYLMLNQFFLLGVYPNNENGNFDVYDYLTLFIAIFLIIKGLGDLIFPYKKKHYKKQYKIGTFAFIFLASHILYHFKFIGIYEAGQFLLNLFN